MSNSKPMAGLRLRGEIWHIQKRCKHVQGGWLRESTGTSSRIEAEKYLMRRLVELEDQSHRIAHAIFTFEEASFRYLEDIAHKPSVDAIAYHIDLLLPFIGQLTLEQVHEGTLKPFIDHEVARGIAPKSIDDLLVSDFPLCIKIVLLV